MSEKVYESIESTTCFNFINLVGKIKSSLLKKYPEVKKAAFRELMYKNLLTFTLNDQQFDYTSRPNHLGGERWFVKCPKCGSPSLKLYLPSAHKNREQRYLCKSCHVLKNASLIMGATKRYRKVVKPLKRLERLRTLLLRKSMTPEKAQPLLDEYKRIEDALASSPEYRLWRFQKEHGLI
jgi:hypothetical protein